ncbi:MAG: hypothetical protein ACXWLH_03080 [Candidatus Saccharimonadales bacterium]
MSIIEADSKFIMDYHFADEKLPDLGILGIPRGQEDLYTLDTDDQDYANMYQVMAHKLGSNNLLGYKVHGHLLTLTRQPDSFDPSVDVLSILRMQNGGGYIQGLAVCMARIGDTTLLQRHSFMRFGTEEIKSPISPIDDSVRFEMTTMLGQVHCNTPPQQELAAA